MEHARQGKRAAAEVNGDIADSAAMWRALVETSGERIVVTDFDGFVIFTNAEEGEGCPGPVGSSIFNLLTPSAAERLRRSFDRSAESGKANLTEIELADDAEQTRCLEMRVVPIKEGRGRGNFLVIAADITSRRRVEEALRESQRFVTRVAEASPAIVYVYDLARSSYVYVNHQVSKILGFSSSEFMQKGFSHSRLLVHPDDVELLAERQRRLPMLKNGTVAECVFRMLNVHSQWVWVRSRETIFTRGKDGQTGQIIGMAEDITQRHTARTELEASREQLRALSARLQDVREAERAAISRRVHDELGQAVTALNMDLARIRKDLASLQTTANSAALIRI
jgi:PAS domain S-box-containing protein